MARPTRTAMETAPATASYPDSSPDTSFSLPPALAEAFHKSKISWDAAGKTNRLWSRDASLWTDNDEAVWLGWLDIVDQQLDAVAKFKALAAEVQEDGYKHILVLGMGCPTLIPEVFSLTYGRQPGFPELLVLDSTDPAQIQNVRDTINPACTLFCVSSKSGTTLETNLFLQYFFDETKKLAGDQAGHHFIAITDPGSALESAAARLNFRHVYLGSSSMGGRYSALSDFGLVPHAAAGLDTEKLLKAAAKSVQACKNPAAAANPGVSLGLLLGTAAVALGRDKVTLLCSESIASLGAWLEQLLAESTGKQGRGLIPVNCEPPVPGSNNDSSPYGKDRVFAYVKLAADDSLDAQVDALESSGEPLVRIVIDNLAQLGQIFFQWQIATAVAASLLGVNPFDQPQVEASKTITRELTHALETTGFPLEDKPLLQADSLTLFADEVNAKHLLKGGSSLGAIIRQHMDQIKPGDYFGLLAYLPMFPEYGAKLQEIRKAVGANNGVATVLGFGPRFLHGTGQAYKGGPNSGVFLQITCDSTLDLIVPQQQYTFAGVQAAQARADFQLLADLHRRVLRVHLGKNLTANLDLLRDLICAAIEH